MSRSLLIAALATIFPSLAVAATPLAQIRYVPDITINLGGTVAGPADVANDDLAGNITLALSGLPANVAAYHYDPVGGVHWLVFDTTVALPGGITATPRDVVAWNGSAYNLLLDGAAAGIPAGVAIDALATWSGADFLLSIDTTAVVGGLTAGPADVVRYSGGVWTMQLDDGASGVPAGVNLDGLEYLSNGNILASFDIAGTVGGVNFNDEDILEFIIGMGGWEMAYPAASFNAAWGPANMGGFSAQAMPPGVPGVLQFTAPTYSVNETGATATITVTRTGGATGAVSVQYATADGSAVQPGDYTSAANTLNWADGDTAAKTFTIAINDDAQVEGNETVLLTLSNTGGGATLGATAAATLTIVDNDLPAGTPMLGLSTPSLAFGNQSISVGSASQYVVVTNNGNATLSISGVATGGANPGDFGIGGNCAGANLAPLASCTVNVVFTPATAGARGATLSIASNDLAQPTASVSLTGTGVAGGGPGVPGVPGGVASIPTLGEWAMLQLAGLLGLLGARFARHRAD
jgi:hypothetical protein